MASEDGEMPSQFEGIDPEQLTESQMQQYMMEMQRQGLLDSNMEGGQYEEGYEEGQEGEGYGEEYGDQDYDGNQNEYDSQQDSQQQGHDQVNEMHQDRYDRRVNSEISGNYEADDETLRKIRRDLLDNINLERRHRDLQPVYIDLTTNNISQYYSEYLVNNEHNQDFYENAKVRYNNLGECELCHITAKFEPDADITKEYIYDYFMEIGYLFLESEEEKRIILNPANNHIGIGVFFDEIQIVVVLILSEKVLCIQKISQPEQNKIEIRGKMLDENFGIYAIRIMNVDDQKKDIKGVGPEFIEYTRSTQEWMASFELELYNQDRMAIEYYTRVSPDSIPYKKKQSKNEKLTYKHLQLRLRTPFQIYPDPKYAAEDEKERIRKEQEILAHEEQERKEREENDAKRLKQSRKDYGDGQYDDDEHGQDDFNSQSDISDKDKHHDSMHAEQEQNQQAAQQQQDTISNKEIRQELEMAITEAQRQHDEFMLQNHKLQEEIKLLKNKNDGFVDRSNETAMNEHKYLNTLAHVHQIRLDLKQTQTRYNQMSQELQKKLEQKQKKCNEIKYAFLELKREVAKKAANSRTDKPIPEQQINEWEKAELQKSKELQELRLQILRLRNAYVKNQKILKKKEELAEGLHLIDFEQLKIENQTLNEKIEERNEELHKLKKKNTTTIQILTHTREKLGFVQGENGELNSQNVRKDQELDDMRKQLTQQKKTKDKLRSVNLTLKQQTGIVNSEELGQDYRDLRTRVSKLEEEKKRLEQKLRSMHEAIKTANQISTQNMQSQNNSLKKPYQPY
ncbi:hypothetical protein TTHERM_00529650 (macronuclear) [Tetrahymena thermophila SB210]|uniref:Cilia- and flagella-associated protein 184 n=1 Tax=Tetrahymena thermophila (strain SB210) TaxID=312017 RepID=CF184_TETTS|nr:hypothetical protein TTHERM_00529650 [Tetrahymena thermophila SB210]EAR85013.1 hypothetical protein TTHERM_00529650 [Tetrahymena thermophila SB210]8TEK_P Chain P, DUF4201 domain-containing protein [Tetrahymena thermophila]8TH8_P Chain P, DUF4201 domain-containing protein [Tetrahymena thermophila]8TID_P Chain P, DUF4201 domain-containing protein [Tetrahymena thermophila]|eukprot:XP_001032676.1 hypothetical protein TTHERM_00529650 [Tetrahymena thermophila SB210]